MRDSRACTQRESCVLRRYRRPDPLRACLTTVHDDRRLRTEQRFTALQRFPSELYENPVRQKPFQKFAIVYTFVLYFRKNPLAAFCSFLKSAMYKLLQHCPRVYLFTLSTSSQCARRTLFHAVAQLERERSEPPRYPTSGQVLHEAVLRAMLPRGLRSLRAYKGRRRRGSSCRHVSTSRAASSWGETGIAFGEHPWVSRFAVCKLE